MTPYELQILKDKAEALKDLVNLINLAASLYSNGTTDYYFCLQSIFARGESLEIIWPELKEPPR